MTDLERKLAIAIARKGYAVQYSRNSGYWIISLNFLFEEPLIVSSKNLIHAYAKIQSLNTFTGNVYLSGDDQE